MQMKRVIGNQNWHRAASCYVRMQVFVLERGLAIDDEFDQADRDGTTYAVIFAGDQPVATGRYLPIDAEQALLTRIATLAAYRGQHLGAQVIQALEDQARQDGKQTLIIHSELTAKGFYQTLGYRPSSAVYQEDGVDCQTLTKQVAN
jgi:predicted GNAT family N-acyltransferase